MITLLNLLGRSFKIKTILKNASKNLLYSTNAANEKVPKPDEYLLRGYQKEKPKKNRKVTVHGGAGNIGSLVCYSLLLKNLCEELVLVELKNRKDPVCGHILDFLYGSAFGVYTKMTYSFDVSSTENSDVIIVCSGMNMKGNQTRLDVLKDNIVHIKEIIPPLAKASPEAVIIIVCNPVDVLTYAAWKYSGFPMNRVLSPGTELDSTRFRFHISKRVGIATRDIQAWIIGEHGLSSVPVWSAVNIAGTKLRDIEPNAGTERDQNNWNLLHDRARKDGPYVRSLKGYTNTGISCMTLNLTEAILQDSQTIFCVSVSPKGFYGMETDCFLSLPCVIGNRGVSKVVKIEITEDEKRMLIKSGCVLQQALDSLKL